MDQSSPLELGEAILGSITDPELFGEYFLPPETWGPWKTVLKCLFGLPITEEEMELFQASTGRQKTFETALKEAWIMCGRRSGKSRIFALIAVCLATFKDYTKYLALGERALIVVIAVDKEQAGVIFGYAEALIENTPMLKRMVERQDTTSIDLDNKVSIEVRVASYRSVRGRTLAAALCDEVAFWRDDTSKNPADAVMRALRPGLATIPGAPLLVASSTYAKFGLLYDSYVKHFGRENSQVLVWKTDTKTMNPTFSQEVIDQAYEEDATSAATEYGSEFRTDVSAFLSDEDVDASIIRDRKSLPMSMSFNYFAFTDLSGGRNDAAAIAIAHQETGGRIILDRLDWVLPPFNPEKAVDQFALLMSGYALSRVIGDEYAAEWVVQAFAKHGIGYEPAEYSKSEIYSECLPLFTARLIEVLDIKALEGQLRQLERRPRTTGRDSIDHPRGGHDDLANAALGAAWVCARSGAQVNEPGRSSVTHAETNYDVLGRDVQVAQIRQTRGIFPYRDEQGVSSAERSYDHLSR
jgi:hypothetical protein